MPNDYPNMVCIINGKGGAGKDTFVNFAKEMCDELEVHLYNISSVHMIKEAAKLLGWQGSKSLEDRKFLSDLKVLASKYNNHSINYMRQRLIKIKQKGKPFFAFFHIREPEEIEEFKQIAEQEVGNVVTLLIKRSALEKEEYGNKGDDEVDNYEYNYIIHNNGTL